MIRTISELFTQMSKTPVAAFVDMGYGQQLIFDYQHHDIPGLPYENTIHVYWMPDPRVRMTSEMFSISCLKSGNYCVTWHEFSLINNFRDGKDPFIQRRWNHVSENLDELRCGIFADEFMPQIYIDTIKYKLEQAIKETIAVNNEYQHNMRVKKNLKEINENYFKRYQ